MVGELPPATLEKEIIPRPPLHSGGKMVASIVITAIIINDPPKKEGKERERRKREEEEERSERGTGDIGNSDSVDGRETRAPAGLHGVILGIQLRLHILWCP